MKKTEFKKLLKNLARLSKEAMKIEDRLNSLSDKRECLISDTIQIGLTKEQYDTLVKEHFDEIVGFEFELEDAIINEENKDE